jgi:tRNA(Leu) C34 or U34 (ribose-2'-O)-methylase TrmL
VTVAVVLCNPKTPYNVGSAIRACSIFGVPTLRWTGTRIATAEARQRAGSGLKGNRPRLPREERMKDYTNVDWRVADADRVVSDLAVGRGLVPVAVELRDGAELLHDFVHPEDALYVFGPEDGSIPRGVLAVCHRFVRIPSANRTPLNLAAALNVVLYDRYAKELRAAPEPSGSTATLVA